jgi:putative PIN family toxin of toxin-antitoxin system
MTVFLDTNVLASAFAARGLCSDVLREVFASHDLYTSIELLEELRGVLKNKFGFPENLIERILLVLHRKANMASSQEQVEIHIKDKADIQIINAALTAGNRSHIPDTRCRFPDSSRKRVRCAPCRVVPHPPVIVPHVFDQQICIYPQLVIEPEGIHNGCKGDCTLKTVRFEYVCLL